MTYTILTLIPISIAAIIIFKMEMKMYEEVMEEVDSLTA